MEVHIFPVGASICLKHSRVANIYGGIDLIICALFWPMFSTYLSDCLCRNKWPNSVYGQSTFKWSGVEMTNPTELKKLLSLIDITFCIEVVLLTTKIETFLLSWSTQCVLLSQNVTSEMQVTLKLIIHSPLKLSWENHMQIFDHYQRHLILKTI
jgi:hypothetical protein